MSLYKIVVADDEQPIRKGLALFDWESCGFELTGIVENGAMALETVRQRKALVVLSDIRMPVMDGLELSRILSEESATVYVILLTGFQDFAYAQQAIQYNVFSLLTKPLDLNQLRGCLLKIRSKIEENLTMEEAQRDRNNHHSVTGNIAAGALLRRYLLGLSVSEEEKSAFVREAGIGGKKSYIRCAVCMAEKEERLTTGRMDGEDDRLVVYRLALGDI